LAPALFVAGADTVDAPAVVVGLGAAVVVPEATDLTVVAPAEAVEAPAAFDVVATPLAADDAPEAVALAAPELVDTEPVGAAAGFPSAVTEN
jgi:hypothetical protein